MNLHPDFIKCNCEEKTDIISMCAAFKMVVYDTPCYRCNGFCYYHKQFGVVKNTTVTADYTKVTFTNNVITYDKYGDIIRDNVPLESEVPIDLKHITVP